jgi:hypothetical protein
VPDDVVSLEYRAAADLLEERGFMAAITDMLRTVASHNVVTVIRDGTPCSWDGCESLATGMAIGRDRHPGLKHYCDAHARTVADEGNPESIEQCPNCGCTYGSN